MEEGKRQVKGVRPGVPSDRTTQLLRAPAVGGEEPTSVSALGRSMWQMKQTCAESAASDV